jgi:hypothetical protein
MTEENIESTNLEDNLPMVNYIMLHRIYDLLTVIGNKIVGGDEISNLVAYHDKGYLLGPAPSYTPDNNDQQNG